MCIANDSIVNKVSTTPVRYANCLDDMYIDVSISFLGDIIHPRITPRGHYSLLSLYQTELCGVCCINAMGLQRENRFRSLTELLARVQSL